MSRPRLTMREMRPVLLAVADIQPATYRDIVQETGIPLSSVLTRVRWLIAAGYLAAEPNKSRTIRLTSRGKDYAHRTRAL